MALKLPPIPPSLRENDYPLFRYLQELFSLFAADGGVGGDNINMAHSQLTGVEGVNGGTGTKHLSDDEYTTLQGQVSAATSSLGAIQSDLSTTQSNLAALTSRVAAGENNIALLQSQINAINVTLADHEARLVAGGL